MNHKISSLDVPVLSTVLKGTEDSNLGASFTCLKLGEMYSDACIFVLHVFRTRMLLGYVSEVMPNQIYQSLCYS